MSMIPSTREPQNPLILRCHRIMDAFAKSNDERDFYLNRTEGFLVYADLDKSQEELDLLDQEIAEHKDEYVMVPKLTFYETKKIMEGFIAEKVYDIDTKEKLLDIIQSKEARENFLEFISDHHAEFEKWQQYYQERSRIRIIEWLRLSHFHFVFEEDLDLDGELIDKLKRNLFETKVGKEIVAARKVLAAKAKTYYSTEALNPRPKRGRPPKQAMKIEIETQASVDIFLTISPSIRSFLYIPDITNASSVNFSAKFDDELDLLMPRRLSLEEIDTSEAALQSKMAALRSLSSRWIDNDSFDDGDDEDEIKDVKTKAKGQKIAKSKSSAAAPAKKSPASAKSPASTTKKSALTPAKAAKATAASKKSIPKNEKNGKVSAKKIIKPALKSKSPALKTTKKATETKTTKKTALRSIVKTKK